MGMMGCLWTVGLWSFRFGAMGGRCFGRFWCADLNVFDGLLSLPKGWGSVIGAGFSVVDVLRRFFGVNDGDVFSWCVSSFVEWYTDWVGVYTVLRLVVG